MHSLHSVGRAEAETWLPMAQACESRPVRAEEGGLKRQALKRSFQTEGVWSSCISITPKHFENESLNLNNDNNTGALIDTS